MLYALKEGEGAEDEEDEVAELGDGEPSDLAAAFASRAAMNDGLSAQEPLELNLDSHLTH